MLPVIIYNAGKMETVKMSFHYEILNFNVHNEDYQPPHLPGL